VPLSSLGPLPQAPQYNQIPAGLHNAMIAPLRHFPVKGVIWYQGETNAGRAYQYRTLFPKLIEDWRIQFRQPEMPFLYVQLANFMDAQDDPNAQSAWAELREAQTMTLQVPHTAMAVTIDVGDARDIHPRDKQSVGERLALAALGTVYDRDVVHSGPQYVGMRIDGDGVRLLFAHVGSGLVARGDRLRGFALAGPDGDFRWADARIDGNNAILVRHPSIDDPRAVRYNWGNNPPGNLYNREGLPAIPFRTDDLPGVTQPR
jgi:sialate O-acetylesterase